MTKVVVAVVVATPLAEMGSVKVATAASTTVPASAAPSAPPLGLKRVTADAGVRGSTRQISVRRCTLTGYCPWESESGAALAGPVWGQATTTRAIHDVLQRRWQPWDPLLRLLHRHLLRRHFPHRRHHLLPHLPPLLALRLPPRLPLPRLALRLHALRRSSGQQWGRAATVCIPCTSARPYSTGAFRGTSFARAAMTRMRARLVCLTEMLSQ